MSQKCGKLDVEQIGVFFFSESLTASTKNKDSKHSSGTWKI